MEVKTLERIGLTPGEIKAYLALLKAGPSSTGGIARHSGVSRSKIYLIMDNLEKKGLASHVDRSGVRYFQAVEPSKIRDYLKEKQGELETLGKEFEKLLPKLEAYHKHAAPAHNITVYQGMKGLRVAHEHSYLKLGRGEEYFILGVPQYPGWDRIRYWQTDHRRRAAAGIGCRLLFNSGADRKILKNRNSFPLCDARYMPIDIDTPAYFMIYKDTVLLIIPSSDPISIEIVSHEVADSFKAYFDEFWKRSRPFG